MAASKQANIHTHVRNAVPLVPSVVLIHGLSETLGHRTGSLSPHLLVVSVPVSIPSFPCFPVVQPVTIETKVKWRKYIYIYMV